MEPNKAGGLPPEPEFTILVVDDEKDARKILCRRLLANNFFVLEAPDGLTGLEIAKKEKPDVILLDIMMPEMDGLKVYQQIRQDPYIKRTPVIFVTALSQNATMDRHSLELIAQTKHGFELEGDYLIVGKPYEPEDLIGEIRRLLKKPGGPGAQPPYAEDAEKKNPRR